MNLGDILVQGLEALSIRIHTESCKKCRKKYYEILKHAKEEAEKREAAKG